MTIKQVFILFILNVMCNATPAQEQIDLASLFSQNDEFLDVDDAFGLTVDVFENELIPSFEIAPGYYLYQHRLKSALKGAQLGDTFLPEGKHKNDEYFGEVQIYQKQLQLSLPFRGANSSFLVELEFQGCAEAGLCYPPTSRYFSIDLSLRTASLIDETVFIQSGLTPETKWAAPPLQSLNPSDSNPALTSDKTAAPANALAKKSPSSKQTSTEFVSEKDQIINTLNESSLLFGFISLIALGIGLAFTPCVFPMMPIISSIIAGQGKDITTSKALLLSLTYTQSMAIPYVIIGFIVAGVGASVTATLQSAPFVLGAAAVFLLLSLGMFGFYEIQLPGRMQNKLNNLSQKQQSGSYLGAAIMGVISGAVVSPCVTIPLIAVLTWISQVGDALTGAFYLYGLAIGMGIPLIIIGVGGGKLLPSAGAWMNTVKSVFGVMMIAVALYITKHLIPGPLNLLMWGALAIVCAVYMGALHAVEHIETGWAKLWKGVGVVLLVYGATLIIGAAQGNHSLLKPLSSGVAHAAASPNSINSVAFTEAQHVGFVTIKSTDDLDRYLAQAKAEGKTVMLDFFAEYCAACYEFAELTFPDPLVQKALSNTLLLQADVTLGDAQDKALMDRFKIFGLPSILFFDQDGNEINSLRAEGFENADTFALRIDAAIGD